jgi:hypothetical protein
MAVVWPARYASGVSASRAQVSGTRRLDCQVRRRQVMTSETTPGASSTAPPERPVRCGADSHADQPGQARNAYLQLGGSVCMYDNTAAHAP